jgi:hypothetical protein
MLDHVLDSFPSPSAHTSAWDNATAIVTAAALMFQTRRRLTLRLQHQRTEIDEDDDGSTTHTADILEIEGHHVVEVRSLVELKAAILRKFDGADWIPDGATGAEVQLLVKNGFDVWVRPVKLSALRSEETVRINVVRPALSPFLVGAARRMHPTLNAAAHGKRCALQRAPLISSSRMDTEEATSSGLPLLGQTASHGAAALLLRRRQARAAWENRRPGTTYVVCAVVCMAIVLFAILGHLCSGHSEWQRQIAELQRYMGHYSGSQHLLAHAPCCRPPSLPSGLQQIDTLELLDAWGSV